MSDLDPRRIPIIGHDIYQVGQVRDIIMQACTPDPLIAVKAFFAYTPMLLWSLVKPSPVDYVTERFGRAHKRRRKGRWALRNVDPAVPPGPGGVRWASWTGLQLQQRIGWYFLVADATTDFAINWLSLAYRFSGCQDPLTGYATATRTTPFEWHSGAPLIQLGGATALFTPGYNANNSNATKLLPGPRSVSAGIDIIPAIASPQGSITKVELREISFAGTQIYELEISPPDAGGNRRAGTNQLTYNLFELAATYQLWVHSTGGFVRIAGWRISVSGLDVDPGYGPDP